MAAPNAMRMIAPPPMQALCHDENGDGASVFRSILDRVGDTWSLLVMGMLQAGPRRFTQLLRTIPGISRRMLTLTLRQLERDGLVAREAFAENPPRVEYRVTELGASISEPILALASWVAENRETIVRNRANYDAEAGSEMEPTLR